MSTFRVTRERIATITPHPNADRLETAQVASMTFQFCLGKSQFAVGDDVVYFPVDAILPPALAAHLGVEKMLGGREHNRIKTVVLRGAVSQGLVERTDKVAEFLGVAIDTLPDDLTAALGVTKYEVPEIPCKTGILVPHPEGVHTYDIEGCDRFPEVVAALAAGPVFITEKLEGSNFYAAVLGDGAVVVGQRNHQIKDIPGARHDWWIAAEAGGILAALPAIKLSLGARSVVVRGEVCGPGVQGNLYGLKERRVFVFDILVDDAYLDADRFLAVCAEFGIATVPVLARDVDLTVWLAGRNIQQAANGKSQLAPAVLREGIVIKPMREARHAELATMGGRLLLKQRDPVYLAKEKD